MKIRDRIKELRRVRAGDLQPHPHNWRTHPESQRNALRGVLAEVGYADALLVRELPDGSLQLIDGHLRAETTPDMEVPVLVLDVDEREAAKLLALIDPLAGMAEADAGVLAELLATVDTENAAVQELLDRMLADAEVPSEEEAARGNAVRGRRARSLSGGDRMRRRTAAARGLRAPAFGRPEVQTLDLVSSSIPLPKKRIRSLGRVATR